MNIRVAKSAGFCFGVKRAVDAVYELLENGDISQEVYNKICWKNAVTLLKLPLTEKDFMV